jgi:DNA-directed RNA polymerase specialized sigma24 family protein
LPGCRGHGPRSAAAGRTLRTIEAAVDYFVDHVPGAVVVARFERHVERSIRLEKLQDAIDRWRAAADDAARLAARNDLIELSLGELRAIAGHLIASLPGASPIGVTELVHEVVVKLLEKLKAEETGSPQQYLKYAGTRIRYFLGDLCKRKVPPTVSLDQVRDGRGAGDESWDLPSTTFDPVKLAILGEIHEQLAKAPEVEQLVFEQRYFLGLTNAMAAQVLGLSEKQVRHAWDSIRLRLARYLKDDLDALS